MLRPLFESHEVQFKYVDLSRGLEAALNRIEVLLGVHLRPREAIAENRESRDIAVYSLESDNAVLKDRLYGLRTRDAEEIGKIYLSDNYTTFLWPAAWTRNWDASEIERMAEECLNQALDSEEHLDGLDWAKTRVVLLIAADEGNELLRYSLKSDYDELPSEPAAGSRIARPI